MNSLVFVAMPLMIFHGALAIQCYRCPHDLSQIMSLMQNPAALNNLCSNPTETIDCSQDATIGQFADACFTSVISLNTSMFGEIKFTQMNCSVKSFCGQTKNMTCELMKSVFQGLPGFEMTNCDYTCCEGDLCNNPSKGSTTKSVAPTASPSPTTPPSSTTLPSPTTSPAPITASAHGPSNAVLSSIVCLICLALINLF